MRLIHEAALVFLLTDIYTKLPITNAVILCNGKQNPYTRKKAGHYVFSNLYPGNYDVNIMCRGYTDINMSVTLRENETQIIVTDIPYTVDNPLLSNLTRFEITVAQDKEALKDKEVLLKLKNEIGFLKLVEPIEAESDDIKLNASMSSGLINQRYIYKKGRKEHELFLWGYDQDKSCYILKEPVKEKINVDGTFIPYWKVKTDSKGRLVLPFLSQFMKDDIIKFELEADGAKANVEADITGLQQSGQVFYLDANLKKSKSK